ncbi:hypothetical protein G7048_15530 [Diaphorobacter sp. HDW4B]|uniref:hypothetical protein n=1 Tax=Diaphorobacter sp. HDW4B TaxID=2714925 RepID=UPI001407B6C6|nr:hypothetical protein [Diaphorobacter sp. HDW4B]QIL71640.1 hypothetical protein G7048_15530 [Diaphorobacter sp. HDW4B]
MNNALLSLINLYAMRRMSAGRVESAKWALRLLWNNSKVRRRRSHVERRAEIERAARQRL